MNFLLKLVLTFLTVHLTHQISDTFYMGYCTAFVIMVLFALTKPAPEVKKDEV